MQILKTLIRFTCLTICFMNVYANDFNNGNFELPMNVGWTSTGYTFKGYVAGLVLPPKSLNDILLTPSSAAPNGINDIITGPTQTLYDWFLDGATPTTTLLLPKSGASSAAINLRPVTTPKAVSGTVSKPKGWQTYGALATALSQTITIDSGDIIDGLVHIRFKLAASMENPAHTAKQQPMYAIQINNLTTGRTGSNPLFFQWGYAAQAGLNWNDIIIKGTNSGSNATYSYLDWQNYDITLSSADFSTGDQIQLIVLAAGCSPGGHDGHVYLDSVSTQPPLKGLEITATGPATANPGGQITYTYTFHNFDNLIALNGVCAQAHMPITQNTSPPYETVYSSSSPTIIDPSNSSTIGSCTYSVVTNSLTCCLSGTLAAGQSGQFTMTVSVPENWQPSYGPINNANYFVEANNYTPVYGNLIQTEISNTPVNSPESYLVVDVNGLKINGQDPILNSGDSYSGSYTCTNTSPGIATASPASCDITGLPPGLTVTGCTKNNAPWTSPYSINLNETVTCHVAGVVLSSISREFVADVSSNAANNVNNVTNHASLSYFIQNNPVTLPATLNGSATLSPVKVCCGRPVVMYDLPIESDLPATYQIVSTTGNVQCRLGVAGTQNYVKLYGRPGSCTVIATKDDQISAPLVLVSN